MKFYRVSLEHELLKRDVSQGEVDGCVRQLPSGCVVNQKLYLQETSTAEFEASIRIKSTFMRLLTVFTTFKQKPFCLTGAGQSDSGVTGT